MKVFLVLLIYFLFIAVIGFSVYIIKNGYPLWALLLMPNITIDIENNKIIIDTTLMSNK